MEKINSIDDIPSWFKLENYDCISQLTIKDIQAQILYRDGLLAELKCIPKIRDSEIFKILEEKNGEITFIDGIKHQQWEQIKSGKVIVEEYSYNPPLLKEKSLAGYIEKLKMASSNFIHGAPSMLASIHMRDLINQGLIEKNDKENEYQGNALFGDIDMVNKKLLSQNHSTVTINIDMGRANDKQIIKDLQQLLPLWRETLNIKEPQDLNYSKPIDYEKAASYKIIPLLDLMIWENIEKLKIPLRVLTVILFPKGEKGETELKQTVIPLAKKFISNKYIHIT